MSDKEIILLIVTDPNLSLNVKRMSNEDFIVLIVTDLNMNLNVQQRNHRINSN